MKREYFSHNSKENSRHARATSTERCIALIDARYLVWLAQHAQSNAQPEQANRPALSDLLVEAMASAG